MPADGRLVSIEKDLQWLLAAKRFCSQAAKGDRASGSGAGSKVDVWLADGRDAAKWGEVEKRLGRPIELLFLDGTPKETLEYLKAAEPHLAPGALVIADNAGERLAEVCSVRGACGQGVACRASMNASERHSVVVIRHVDALLQIALIR